jgi:small subunit ribosomal protein S9
MARKKKEMVTAKEKETEKTKKQDKYFYAVGRRKTSVAEVRLFSQEKAGENELVVNKKKLKEYFPTAAFQNISLAPFKSVGTSNKFRALVTVRGGGFRGQSEAIRLGISRALVVFDGNLKKALKDVGFLTRDSRIVERKKPGLKKARKAPQWAKR